ncbi:hypothetical protein DCAR_0624447 [Daucus carota subsp. sativus]|uniref:PB1-like domain-containing protein n=1 Tax=Daucus carota subsp. sativus TaxID=79200 RepID=A0AAF0XC06_DAUCS|nr:PREDICTED: uncharacterized protein LOC108226672 [Daucus carota subsp. sativus]XP_017257156.1 PREDICTED: uncharacterized protein LOC108226673 [Daucus carota subsp. sativus]XP_017257158.1 PREDICTED: uncharacterized protein LOC108226675 [Daucus carota subsp. sativus]WOH05035.1 hypothetical protein DCAR_0624447 [Daucus carota subsp. sativus]
MDTICKVEIHHGGKFETREGVYYYKGGTIDNIYNVDVSALTIDRFLNFLHDIGYGNGLKLYYQNPLTTGKESYVFLWNDESVRKLHRDALSLGYVSLFVDHCAEEKQKNVVEEHVSSADNEGDDSNFEDEDYSDSSGDGDEFISDNDIDIESDVDDELQSIRENKKKLLDGQIDPLKEGNLTDMHINNGDYNAPVHPLYLNDQQHVDQHERHEKWCAKQYDEYMGDMPQWNELVPYELDLLGNIFPQFEDNNVLGCERVDKMIEDGELIKKHRRREADEEGGGTKLSKKGILMRCSRCLVIGHNRATCKTSEAEVLENQKKAAEAKKAQSVAAKAHSLRNKQNVRKKTQQTKDGHTRTSANPGQKKKATTSTEPPAQPKKRGRPPKAAPPVQKVKKTSGVGVFVGDDGHTYLSSSTTTMKVTS